MQIGKFYYSELYRCYFMPLVFHIGDFYKGICVEVNEFGYSKIYGTDHNFKNKNFIEITENQFYNDTRIALLQFKPLVNKIYEND